MAAIGDRRADFALISLRAPCMKTSRVLRFGIALEVVLLSPFVALAVTDTWDGGGADDDFSTNANWVDNSAPVSNLASTDLIFEIARGDGGCGGSRTFSVRSLTFNAIPPDSSGLHF